MDRSSLMLSDLLHALSIAITFWRETVENRSLLHMERHAAAQAIVAASQTYSTLLRHHETELEVEQLQKAFGRIRHEP